MTRLQINIAANETFIEDIGYQMLNGFFDKDNEELARVLALLISTTDKMRQEQEEIFNKFPWLRRAANR